MAKVSKPNPAAVHYVDNKEFLRVLIAYKVELKTDPEAPIPEYIGECLLQIARRVGNKANFANYSYKDDMISDAVENCILYLGNFDPAKSSNPFAYFTQIIHFAFIRRIAKEKKQFYTKLKYAQHRSLIGEDHASSNGDDTDLQSPNWLHYDNIQAFVEDYESKLLAKPKRKAILDELDDDADTLDTREEFDTIDELEALDKVSESFDALSDDDVPTELVDAIAETEGFDEIPESLKLNGE